MRRALLLLPMLLLTACAVGSDDPPAVEADPGTTIAGTPAIVVTTATTSSTVGSSGDGTTTTNAPTTTSTVPPSVVGRVDDRAGDAGAGAVAYADAVSVEVLAAGDRLAVRVTLAGAIPARLPEGEVAGIGIDLWRAHSTARQSDWNLFADGEPDGWYGYLDGPDGVTTLPGSLTIDGRTITFELAWSSVGDPRAGEVSAFVDWSRDGFPLDTTTQDRAPDAGRGAFRRD